MADNTVVTLPRGGNLKKVRVTDVPYVSNSGSRIANSDTNYVNSSIQNIRVLSTVKAIRALSRVNGMVSTAVQSYISLAMSGYSVAGYDTATHLFSREGTVSAQTVLAGMDTLNDYSEGFNDKTNITALLETLLKEVILTGGCAGELVLNKYRMPDRIVPFQLDTVYWVAKKDKKKYPAQRAVSGGIIALDLPTVWVEMLNREAASVYPRSMLESCLNTIYMYLDFLEDMSKAVRKSGHTRLNAKVIVEKVIASAPSDIKSDPKKMTAYLESVRNSAEDVIKTLEPDDAIVSFDNIEFDTLSDKSAKSEYTSLLESLNGLVATSLKSMPSVLGMRVGKGSQSMSNTETLLYIKQVEAARAPVESLMSRALTLATRLTGSNTYVKFKFDPVDLRPSNEIEAHMAIKQSRVMEQLSLGFITDEEASYMLGTGFRDPSAPKLSGTMFRENNQVAVNPNKISPNNGAQEKALTSTGTSGGRGKNNKQGA